MVQKGLCGLEEQAADLGAIGKFEARPVSGLAWWALLGLVVTSLEVGAFELAGERAGALRPGPLQAVAQQDPGAHAQTHGPKGVLERPSNREGDLTLDLFHGAADALAQGVQGVGKVTPVPLGLNPSLTFFTPICTFPALSPTLSR